MARGSVELTAESLNPVASGQLLGILEPLLRLPAYSANHKLPSVLPPPGALIHAFVHGRLDKDNFDEMMRFNGCACFRTESGKGFPLAWQRVIDASFREYDRDDLWRLFCRGVIDGEQLANGVRVLGYRGGSQVGNIVGLLTVPPEPGTIVRFWRRDEIARDMAVAMLMESARFTVQDANKYLDTSDWIPGPHDLIRWMVRDVEDKTVYEPEKLDTDFDNKFKGLIEQYCEWQGVSRETMLRFWRAHWDYPSNQQLYECLHRLREDNIADYQALVPGVKPVSQDDVKRVLKINDLAPAWVDRLVAISFRRVTRRDLRILIKWDRITLAQVTGYLRDQGYSPRDAELMANAIYLDARPDKQESIVREGKAAIRKAYNLGAIELADVRFLCREYGLYDDEIERFIVGLRLADSVEMLDAAVKATRVIFLNGNYDRIQAQANLAAAGVLPDRARRFVDLWALSLLKGRRVISESRARTQYVEGVISFLEYTNVIRNLGFSDADQDRLAREAEFKRAEYVIAIERKAIQEARAELARERADLARSGNKAQILKWLKEGLISPEAAEERLLFLGVDPADVERYFSELGSPYHGQPAPARPGKPSAGKPAKPAGSTGSHVTLSGAKVPPAGTACKWFRDRVIDEAKFREYLSEIGYEGEEQDHWIADCLPKGEVNAQPTA